MGDHFQTIVDVECQDEGEAQILGERLRAWLIERGVVAPEPTRREHVPEGSHEPGPRFGEALEEPIGADDEEHTRRLWMNVVDVIARRMVHDPGQFDCELVCASCGQRHAQSAEWGEAVAEWFEEQGPGLLACPRCGASRGIAEWEHDPPCGFSALGVSFWNWPPLHPRFVEEVGALLRHRVIVVTGKL